MSFQGNEYHSGWNAMRKMESQALITAGKPFIIVFRYI